MAPRTFFWGGLFEIFGERRGRRRYQVSLAVTGGRAALPKLLEGSGGGRCGDNGGNQDTRRLREPQSQQGRSHSNPPVKSQRINKLLCEHEWLHRTGATAAGLVIPELFLFLLGFFFCFFLSKYERPFQRSLLCCDYPRAIKKKNQPKKQPSKSLQQLLCIKAAAFRHQPSDKQLSPQMLSFQTGWEPGGRRGKSTAGMNQDRLFQPTHLGDKPQPLLPALARPTAPNRAQKKLSGCRSSAD